MLCDNLEENVACITWPLQLQQMPNSWYHVQHNQVRVKRLVRTLVKTIVRVG